MCKPLKVSYAIIDIIYTILTKVKQINFLNFVNMLCERSFIL